MLPIVDKPLAERVEKLHGIVEKPKPEDAPFTLAVVGRYMLTPRIFHHLENATMDSSGEIQLTDAIAALLTEQQVLACRYQGVSYDSGSKIGHFHATVELGQKHPEVGDESRKYLATRIAIEDK